MYVQFIGNLFLQMLKGIIIPLVIPSLIAAIGSMNIGLSGKVGLRAIVYYLVTTVLAVILGIILVVAIRPGGGQEQDGQDPYQEGKKQNVTTADTMMDLLRNCFPRNLLQATLQQYRTELIYPGEMIVSFNSNFISVEPSDSFPPLCRRMTP